MAPRCSVCSHPSHEEINLSLAAGVPYRPLAQQFNLSLSALSRHSKHLTIKLFPLPAIHDKNAYKEC